MSGHHARQYARASEGLQGWRLSAKSDGWPDQLEFQRLGQTRVPIAELCISTHPESVLHASAGKCGVKAATKYSFKALILSRKMVSRPGSEPGTY